MISFENPTKIKCNICTIEIATGVLSLELHNIRRDRVTQIPICNKCSMLEFRGIVMVENNEDFNTILFLLSEH